MKIPPELLDAMAKDDGTLQAFGTRIGKLYTDHGLPIDMALDKLEHSKLEKIAILAGAQSWMIEHRRNSGATENALNRMRATNREVMERFIRHGETGIY